MERDVSEPSISDRARVQLLDGKEFVFESQGDLDETIRDCSNQRSKCVCCGHKEFRKAQSLQGFVNEMDAFKPRLPTLREELIDELKKMSRRLR